MIPALILIFSLLAVTVVVLEVVYQIAKFISKEKDQ